MKPTPNLAVEKYRVKVGPYATSRYDGNNGMFVIPNVDPLRAERGLRPVLMCIVSDGSRLDEAIDAGVVSGIDATPWEHVSVSVKLRPANGLGEVVEAGRCPTWEEMCLVKDIFWQPEEVVVQYHPRASQYRNLHHHCLHLWRPLAAELPEPDPEFVAPKRSTKGLRQMIEEAHGEQSD